MVASVKEACFFIPVNIPEDGCLKPEKLPDYAFFEKIEKKQIVMVLYLQK
jgi:hypothetical protein